MRRLPWHLAVRADRRALLTALGVALGVAFTVVSFAVPTALRTESVSPEGPFGRQDVVVMAPGLVPFDPAGLDLEAGTEVLLAEVDLEEGDSVTLVAFQGPRAPPLEENTAYPAAGAHFPSTALVPNGTATELLRGQPLDLPILSRNWIAVAPATMERVRPDLAGLASYVLMPPPMDAATAQRLEAAGYRLAPTPGLEPFFRASAKEIAMDLLLVVLFCSALIALFTYEFLRSEVRERWREIGLWRALGMRPLDVLALLLTRALALTFAGALAGAGAAYVILQGAARATGASIFTVSMDASTAGLLALVFLLAGVLGGLLPARAAAVASVREQLEAQA